MKCEICSGPVDGMYAGHGNNKYAHVLCNHMIEWENRRMLSWANHGDPVVFRDALEKFVPSSIKLQIIDYCEKKRVDSHQRLLINYQFEPGVNRELLDQAVKKL